MTICLLLLMMMMMVMILSASSLTFVGRDASLSALWFRCDAIERLSPSLDSLIARATAATSSTTRSLWLDLGSVTYRNVSFTALLPPSEEALARHLSMWTELMPHPSAPRYVGWCIRESKKGPSVLLREELLSWHDWHARKQPWCVRLHAALSAASLLAFMEDEWTADKHRSRGATVFCDMATKFWMFRQPTFDIVLVSLDELQVSDTMPLFAAAQCQPHSTTCVEQCFRHFAAIHKVPLGEFECTPSGQCLGFDPHVSVFALAKVVLTELLSESALLADDAPVETVDEIHTSVLRRALALHRRDRLSARQLFALLRRISLGKDATQCAHEHHLERDAAFYGAESLTMADVRRNPMPLENWPAMTIAVLPAHRPSAAAAHSDSSIEVEAAFSRAWQQQHKDAHENDKQSVAALLASESADERHIKNTFMQLREHHDDAYFRGLEIAAAIAKERKPIQR
jgi:hypothetical protein